MRERRGRLTLLPSLLPSPPAPFTPRSERAEIVAAHNRRKKDMADVNAAMEAQFGDVEAELKQEFETAWEELKNKNSEDYNVLKLQLEGVIDELERQFEQARRRRGILFLLLLWWPVSAGGSGALPRLLLPSFHTSQSPSNPL